MILDPIMSILLLSIVCKVNNYYQWQIAINSFEHISLNSSQILQKEWKDDIIIDGADVESLFALVSKNDILP